MRSTSNCSPPRTSRQEPSTYSSGVTDSTAVAGEARSPPEPQIPAWPVVPATRHRNLLLVVAQRKPRLLGRDRRSGLRIRKQQRDVVLVPPRRPLRQPAFSHGGTQELQPLGRRGRGRPGTGRQPCVDEQAPGDRTPSRLHDDRNEQTSVAVRDQENRLAPR